MEDLKNIRWDLPGYYLQGNTLYVHLNDGVDPNTADMKVSRYPYALWISGGNTYLLNLTFQHYSESRFQQGAVHLASSDNLLQGNIFVNTHAGIAVEPDANRNLIQENTFSDGVFDWRWDAVYVVSEGRKTDPTYLAQNTGIRFLTGNQFREET